MPSKLDEARLRDKLILLTKTDLIGPETAEETLTESPMFAYLTGMIYPEGISTSSEKSEQELGLGDGADKDDEYNQEDDEDDGQIINVAKFKQPTSIGATFYTRKDTKSIIVDIEWGDYVLVDENGDEALTDNATQNEDEFLQKTKCRRRYQRIPRSEKIKVNFDSLPNRNEYSLSADESIKLKVNVFGLVNEYQIIGIFIANGRSESADPTESIMFQIQLTFSAIDEGYFIAENICRNSLADSEYLYSQRPVFGRGKGCAISWQQIDDSYANKLSTTYVPEYEISGISASFSEFAIDHFSTLFFSKTGNRKKTIERLDALAISYEKWIGCLKANPKMSDPDFYEKTGRAVIAKCDDSLRRIKEGIDVLAKNDIAFESFVFVNQVIRLQKNISSYSIKHGAGIDCNFSDFTDPSKPENTLMWYPFQMAFILMNINSIINPLCGDRNIVDLLYFPTGGGKTEAYLGLISFAIANRRLSRKPDDELNKDGGVTAILRYTLRLLTTQQRDRITKMIVAAEFLRKKDPSKYGEEPISIGFWVGGEVTPNSYSELTGTDIPKIQDARRKIHNQLLTCPFCGNPLDKEFCFQYDDEKEEVRVYCEDPHCIFYKYNDNPSELMSIPVHLIDEQIYRNCPTVVIATVDKFARLPWDVRTNALFGRVRKRCTRHGFVALGETHEYTHLGTPRNPNKATCPDVKMFAPPDIIVQDELHLITGPLGTIYGGYETIIEDFCSYELNGIKIKPKYICSTATIKNAEEQIKSLYGRKSSSVFPSKGLLIGDSFFVREEPLDEKPFRKYVGICAPGQSMKTTILRTYAVILQSSCELSKEPSNKDIIDPYYSLIGYFNSIRELGGTVRLLQDDIPKRINRIKNRYKYEKARPLYPDKQKEITSRIPSKEITKKLQELESPFGTKGCIDTALATNMIAVGMDVDRLGLMVVMGQPKLNSEYIQATSRIGRKHPGVVFTVYNPYRPRDLSHYENFTGYHMQLYRYVDGTTATPFSARARDRVIHAIIIAALRMKYPEMAAKPEKILNLSDNQIDEVIKTIEKRIQTINPRVKDEALREIKIFISNWKAIARGKPMKYSGKKDGTYAILMVRYEEDNELGLSKSTLNSMREVENSAVLYYEKGL